MMPRPPASLVHYLRDKRCALFCGSGLSAWAKLPTWSQLLIDTVRELAQETPDDPNQEELRRLNEAGKLLDIADHCKVALGQRYNEILSEQLRGATGEIPEPHKIIVKLPFSAVVTTNYDKLLERAYAEVGNLPKTPTHRDIDILGPLLFDGSFFILKAHGDIDRPDSMILTTSDYQELIHTNAAFNSFFSALLLTKCVLFIGYSLSDPDFRLLLDRQLTVFSGNIPNRYALMTGVGNVEREVLWRTARIRVIPYEEGKHEQVLEFLRILDELLNGAATPAVDASIYALEPPSATVVPTQQFTTTGVAGRINGDGPARLPSHLLSLRFEQQRLGARFSSSGALDVVQGIGSALDWPKLTAMIRNTLRSPSMSSVSTVEIGKSTGQELAKLLPSNVLDALVATPAGQTITLQIASELELLPWEWSVVDGDFLFLRNPLVRVPIGVTSAARGYPFVRVPARVLLIGDPNQSDPIPAPLPGALAEVEEIAKVYSDRPDIKLDLLIGAEASFRNIAKGLLSGGYDVIHFAGHAWFDELEPYLVLSQGDKLRVSEMRSLLSSQPPAILFLNSHYTAFGSAGRFARKRGHPGRPDKARFEGTAWFHRSRINSRRWYPDRRLRNT